PRKAELVLTRPGLTKAELSQRAMSHGTGHWERTRRFARCPRQLFVDMKPEQSPPGRHLQSLAQRGRGHTRGDKRWPLVLDHQAGSQSIAIPSPHPRLAEY